MKDVKNIGVTIIVSAEGVVNASLDVPEGLAPGSYTGTIEAVIVEESLRLGDRVSFLVTPLNEGEQGTKDYYLRKDNQGTVVDIGVGEKRGAYVVEWDGAFRTDKEGNPDYRNRTVLLNREFLEVIVENIVEVDEEVEEEYHNSEGGRS